jgi:hypothetical protein
MFDADRIDPNFKMTIGFAENRPMSMDFEQSMNIKVSPGAPGTFAKDEPC